MDECGGVLCCQFVWAGVECVGVGVWCLCVWAGDACEVSECVVGVYRLGMSAGVSCVVGLYGLGMSAEMSVVLVCMGWR